jgi:hypothetical protein
VLYLSHVKNDEPRREGARITVSGNEFVDCRATLEMRIDKSTSTCSRISFAQICVNERANCW